MIKKYKIYWCEIRFADLEASKVRPCIVLKIKNDMVRVLPITSIQRNHPLVEYLSKIDGVPAYVNFNDSQWITRELVLELHDKASLLQKKGFINKDSNGMTVAEVLEKKDDYYEMNLRTKLSSGVTFSPDDELYYKLKNSLNRNKRKNNQKI
jgi:hypothetical protein